MKEIRVCVMAINRVKENDSVNEKGKRENERYIEEIRQRGRILNR